MAVTQFNTIRKNSYDLSKKGSIPVSPSNTNRSQSDIVDDTREADDLEIQAFLQPLIQSKEVSFVQANESSAENRLARVPHEHAGDEARRTQNEEIFSEVRPADINAPSPNIVSADVFVPKINNVVESLTEIHIPIASTDYKGLERVDPRLVDRVWRLNNLYTVVNEAGEIVRFKMRPAQLRLLSNLHFRNIILKARQLGFTTFICIFMLDYALFNKNKMVGILAHTQLDAGIIFKKVKTAWNNFPQKIKDYIKLETIGDSKIEYEFSNGSTMRIATSLRSGTYQMILITEYGKICARFPDRAEEVKTGTLPAVPVNGVVFIESTAEGEGGEYYDMVKEARELKFLNVPLSPKDYRFFFFPWYQNPANQIHTADTVDRIDIQTNDYLDKLERDVIKKKLPQSYRNWYYLEKKLQKDKMAQEHPSTPEEAFLSTGNKLFKAAVCEAQKKKYAIPPIEVIGDFHIFVKYQRGHVYGLGADVSQGVMRDSSTMVVIDFTAGEIVATYRSNKIDPVSFAYDIKTMALMYGGCIAAAEANLVGGTTNAILNQIYGNIYTQVRDGLLEDHPTQKLGWLSTGASKPKMMYEFSEALEHDTLKCRDEAILIEARMFNKEDALVVQVNENTTRHFDKLCGAAIAWQTRSVASKGQADEATIAQVEERRAHHLTRQKSSYR